MYVETQGGDCVCLGLLDVNAWGDQGEAGWVACICMSRRMRNWFCLGLLDVKAWGDSRRGGMGGLHMYVET